MIVESPNDRSSPLPLNRGLKAFVIPHAAFDPDHRLLTGVMISNSRQWYPVVGRIAMVHLGFSGLNKITDETVGIRFFEDHGQLKEDTVSMCSRLNLEAGYAEKANAYVLSKINNYPTVDLNRNDRRPLGLLRALTIEEDGREPPP